MGEPPFSADTPAPTARPFGSWVVASAFFLAADLVSKGLVAEYLLPGGRVIPVVPGLFSINPTVNTGMAFSLFAGGSSTWKTSAFTLVAAVALGYVAWLVRSRSLTGTCSGLALAMLAGGIVGNTIDRVHRGAVVDFLDFHIGHYAWPTFNLADTFICLGAGWVVLHVVRGEKKRKGEAG